MSLENREERLTVRDRAIQVIEKRNLCTGEVKFCVAFSMRNVAEDFETAEKAESMAKRIREWVRLWDR